MLNKNLAYLLVIRFQVFWLLTLEHSIEDFYSLFEFVQLEKEVSMFLLLHSELNSLVDFFIVNLNLFFNIIFSFIFKELFLMSYADWFSFMFSRIFLWNAVSFLFKEVHNIFAWLCLFYLLID